MKTKTYSVQRYSSGKHDVTIWRSEAADYLHDVREAFELREYVQLKYDLNAADLARELMEAFFDCVRVEVTDWNRNGVVLVKEEK